MKCWEIICFVNSSLVHLDDAKPILCCSSCWSVCFWLDSIVESKKNLQRALRATIWTISRVFTFPFARELRLTFPREHFRIKAKLSRWKESLLKRPCSTCQGSFSCRYRETVSKIYVLETNYGRIRFVFILGNNWYRIPRKQVLQPNISTVETASIIIRRVQDDMCWIRWTIHRSHFSGSSFPVTQIILDNVKWINPQILHT